MIYDFIVWSSYIAIESLLKALRPTCWVPVDPVSTVFLQKSEKVAVTCDMHWHRLVGDRLCRVPLGATTHDFGIVYLWSKRESLGECHQLWWLTWSWETVNVGFLVLPA